MRKILIKYLFYENPIELLKKEFKPFLFAISLLLISARLSNHFVILWGICFYIFYNKSLKIKWNSHKYNILKIIIILSVINECIYIITGNTLDISLEYIIPYSILILFTVALSDKVDDRIIKWFILAVVIEFFVGVLELSAGVVSFWAVEDKDIIESELLYDRKVFGLDTNSSGFAYRIVFALLLYNCYKSCRVIKELPFYMLIAAGLLISFNRTAILASLFFIGICIWQSKYKLLLLIPPVLIVIYIAQNPFLWEILLSQFTRGDTEFATVNALSERDIVYPFYINYIKDNFMFGHGSFKYYVEIMKDGRMFHAHNSYLQTLANNGIPISLLYFGLIGTNVSKRNYMYILPLLLMSCFQCLILWGISLPDILFYKLLFDKTKKKNEGIIKKEL